MKPFRVEIVQNFLREKVEVRIHSHTSLLKLLSMEWNGESGEIFIPLERRGALFKEPELRKRKTKQRFFKPIKMQAYQFQSRQTDLSSEPFDTGPFRIKRGPAPGSNLIYVRNLKGFANGKTSRREESPRDAFSSIGSGSCRKQKEVSKIIFPGKQQGLSSPIRI